MQLASTPSTTTSPSSSEWAEGVVKRDDRGRLVAPVFECTDLQGARAAAALAVASPRRALPGMLPLKQEVAWARGVKPPMALVELADDVTVQGSIADLLKYSGKRRYTEQVVHLASHGSLTHDGLKVLRSIGETVAAAHSQHIVLRCVNTHVVQLASFRKPTEGVLLGPCPDAVLIQDHERTVPCVTAIADSLGWRRAPEQRAAGDDGMTWESSRVDCWAFGTLLYEVATDGGSPFGQGVARQPDLQALADPMLRHLVQWLLQRDPKDRPTMGQALAHPLWSSDSARASFYVLLSEHIRACPLLEKALRAIKMPSPGLFGPLPEALADRIRQPPNQKLAAYDNSANGLLRLIANCCKHADQIRKDLVAVQQSAQPSQHGRQQQRQQRQHEQHEQQPERMLREALKAKHWDRQSMYRLLEDLFGAPVLLQLWDAYWGVPVETLPTELRTFHGDLPDARGSASAAAESQPPQSQPLADASSRLNVGGGGSSNTMRSNRRVAASTSGNKRPATVSSTGTDSRASQAASPPHQTPALGGSEITLSPFGDMPTPVSAASMRPVGTCKFYFKGADLAAALQDVPAAMVRPLSFVTDVLEQLDSVRDTLPLAPAWQLWFACGVAQDLAYANAPAADVLAAQLAVARLAAVLQGDWPLFGRQLQVLAPTGTQLLSLDNASELAALQLAAVLVAGGNWTRAWAGTRKELRATDMVLHVQRMAGALDVQDGAIAARLRATAPGILNCLWEQMDWQQWAMRQVQKLVKSGSNRVSILTLAERMGYSPSSTTSSSSSSRSSSVKLWARSRSGRMISTPLLLGEASCCYSESMPSRLAEQDDVQLARQQLQDMGVEVQGSGTEAYVDLTELVHTISRRVAAIAADPQAALQLDQLLKAAVPSKRSGQDTASAQPSKKRAGHHLQQRAPLLPPQPQPQPRQQHHQQHMQGHPYSTTAWFDRDVAQWQHMQQAQPPPPPMQYQQQYQRWQQPYQHRYQPEQQYFGLPYNTQRHLQQPRRKY